MRKWWNACKRRAQSFRHAEDGIGTLEIILIIAVLIIIALLFKDWIIELVNDLMGKASDKADEVFD
ncbi:Flp1 family type IVb pilin [Paenibacillus cisolokensis]|uniref:Flp1 family type IVb pilin n=1 Tax=Paenibacillus TaxID=44249 RepID=UPI000720B539|nr:Flp1 family type IVb pilin [Paenibacillus sp. 32O-W]ALS29524.1 putative Flp1-like flagellin [Paenibacillus sp. 32O-W]